MSDHPYRNHTLSQLAKLARDQIDGGFSTESNALSAMHLIAELLERLKLAGAMLVIPTPATPSSGPAGEAE